jgi:hypothetical protein
MLGVGKLFARIDVANLVGKSGGGIMELNSDADMGAIERHLGPKAAKVAAAAMFVSLVAGSLGVVFGFVLLPVYRVIVAPTHTLAFWKSQADVASPLSTLMIIALIAYFLFVDPPARKLTKQNEEMRELIAGLIKLYDLRSENLERAKLEGRHGAGGVGETIGDHDPSPPASTIA